MRKTLLATGLALSAATMALTGAATASAAGANVGVGGAHVGVQTSSKVWMESVQDGVNVRSAPNTGARSLGKLHENEKVLAALYPESHGFYPHACGPSGGTNWYEVSYHGKNGWVAADCLSLTPAPPGAAPTPLPAPTVSM